MFMLAILIGAVQVQGSGRPVVVLLVLTSRCRVDLEPATTVYIHILLDSYVTIMLTFKAKYLNV
jgi:hypothetical protein